MQEGRQGEEGLVLGERLDRLQALAQVVEVRADVRTDGHVRPDALVPEEGLVIQGLASGGADVDTGLHGAAHENVLAEASGRVGVSIRPCLQREGVDARIGGLGEQGGAEHDDERFVGGLADLARALEPLGRERPSARARARALWNWVRATS